MREVEWARMTAPELRAIAMKENALAILPIGSLEQHGPHLPVITDTASALAAAVRAAQLVAEEVPVAVLPGLWLGLSEHHLPFGGTISIDYETLNKILVCIVRSLKALGFDRLLIVNGHGGNVEPLAVSVRELSVEYGLPIVSCLPWGSAREEMEKIFDVDQGCQHACEGETSVMLAIAPQTVRADQFDMACVDQTHPLSPPLAGTRFFSFAKLAPITGTFGDPRTATAEKGERFLDLQAAELVKLIQHEFLWTTPDPVWRPRRGLQYT
ncbi:creatininase family protein [Sinorhizobium meliloti]|uniref:creatininase family protein n=1 Tax=Rhizobium meliloti TaxID=382 RepID=UPI00129536E7|nr:creatininase family protein [Sinorhizobium meliloti]MQW14023.1 creatininase family protein [Sinorhizobium meliloti]